MVDKKEEANKNSEQSDFLFKKMNMLSSEISYMILPVHTNPELFSVVHNKDSREITQAEALGETFKEIIENESQSIVLFFNSKGEVVIRNIGGVYVQPDGTVRNNIVNYAKAWVLLETGLQHLIYTTYMTGVTIKDAFTDKNAKLEYRKGSEKSLKKLFQDIVSYWDNIISAANSIDSNPIAALSKVLGIDLGSNMDKDKMN